MALSGDGQFLVVHAPLPYSRLYNTPGNENSGNVYTYKLVRPPSSMPHMYVQGGSVVSNPGAHLLCYLG